MGKPTFSVCHAKPRPPRLELSPFRCASSHPKSRPRVLRSPEEPAVGRSAGAGLHDAASRVLLDEILNFENLRLGRELDAHVAEDGHQLLTVSLELLARTPDFAGAQVVIGPERDVDFESGG